jgi:hypothetical protein
MFYGPYDYAQFGLGQPSPVPLPAASPGPYPTAPILSSDFDTWWNSFIAFEYHGDGGEIPDDVGLDLPGISPTPLVPGPAGDSELTAGVLMQQPAQAVGTPILADDGGLSASATDKQDGGESLELISLGDSRTPEFQIAR